MYWGKSAGPPPARAGEAEESGGRLCLHRRSESQGPTGRNRQEAQDFIEPFNLSFFSITGWGIDLDYYYTEWFALETNRDHSVLFQIAERAARAAELQLCAQAR